MDLDPRVAELCREAGLVVMPLGDAALRLEFTGELGTIDVFVRACGELRGSLVIEVGTMGIELPQDPADRAALAEAALARNAGLIQGRWAIETAGEGAGAPRRLTVVANLIADGLGPAWLRSAAETVALEHLSLLAALKEAERR